jgi:hypothetical protein
MVPETFIYRRVGTSGCEILADGEVGARMFAVEPTPQETDALCDRLFHGQD